MDPDAFSASLFKWDPRGATPQPHRLLEAVAPPHTYCSNTRPPRDVGGLDVFFQAYGVRYYTAAKISELGFTVSTLLDMKDEELEEMMTSLSQIFRWDLLVGESYGIKAAIRAERRRLLLLEEEESRRRHHLLPPDATNALDALSQEGLSKEPVQQEKEAMGSGGGGATSTWTVVAERKKQQRQRRKKRAVSTKSSTTTTTGNDEEVEEEEEEEEEAGDHDEEKGRVERQREHPFIVTEPGEVARGKKNGIDYLFHLYEQCRDFLIHVQNIARERGEKCPTKVNQSPSIPSFILFFLSTHP